MWLAFAIFGALSFIDLGFGFLIIINCLTYNIAEGFKRKSWNPGLVIAMVAAYYVTTHSLLDNSIAWCLGTIIFLIVAHILLFNLVMSRLRLVIFTHYQ